MDQLNSEKFTVGNIFYYPLVNSTNQVAHRLALQGAVNGTTVIAEEQSEGRGRYGRTWFSPPHGGLWFSIILRPENYRAAETPPLSLVTAAVIANYLKHKFSLPASVKWPNDLLLNDRKICGILTEINTQKNRLAYLIIGIGLNINQDLNVFPIELREKATSLAVESKHYFDRTSLFLSLREELLNSYHHFFEAGFDPYKKLWKKYSSTLGQKITITFGNGSITGLARDISSEGALLVEDKENITHTLNYGEVSQFTVG